MSGPASGLDGAMLTFDVRSIVGGKGGHQMLVRMFLLTVIILSTMTSLVFSALDNSNPIAVLINDSKFENKISSLEKTLVGFEADYEIYMTFNYEFPEPGSFSALIIGGGTSMDKYFDDTGARSEGSELIENSEVPVLGICLGCQIIGRLYGGRLCFFEQRGWSKMEILKDDPILDGLDSSFDAWSNHGFGIAVVPEGFELICRGEENSIQIIRHSERPIYGILFHPEVVTERENPAKRIIENFVDYAETYAGEEAERLCACENAQ